MNTIKTSLLNWIINASSLFAGGVIPPTEPFYADSTLITADDTIHTADEVPL